MSQKDTIAALATPSGRGGIGILRVSGCQAEKVAYQLLGKLPKPRYADYLSFKDLDGSIIDQGIAIWFPGPDSFTGEDVLELQGHGGPIVLDLLLKCITSLPGVRVARPGEFSERAFLNDKLDLAQAEAIADLIDASSEKAARAAMCSLQGVFSSRINHLIEKLIQLRIWMEAAIDFPDEEIDFLSDGRVASQLEAIIDDLDAVKAEARQGSLLREGMKVVIAGRPNAGKSSLLNALAGRETAIVTRIAGTTRDVLREHIHIDGMPLHLIDTAGLRETTDEVERIGIERAWAEIHQADHILLIVDAATLEASTPLSAVLPDFISQLPNQLPVTVIRNKVDVTREGVGIERREISGQAASVCTTILSEPAVDSVQGIVESGDDGVAERLYSLIRLSAHTGEGVELLRNHLKEQMGMHSDLEGNFLARHRHLDALRLASVHLQQAKQQLIEYKAAELLAEELRLAQEELNGITGRFTSDALLGRIFSSFCIGK